MLSICFLSLSCSLPFPFLSVSVSLCSLSPSRLFFFHPQLIKGKLEKTNEHTRCSLCCLCYFRFRSRLRCGEADFELLLLFAAAALADAESAGDMSFAKYRFNSSVMANICKAETTKASASRDKDHASLSVRLSVLSSFAAVCLSLSQKQTQQQEAQQQEAQKGEAQRECYLFSRHMEGVRV